MRFVLFQENGVLRGETHHRRFMDTIEEAVFAEEMGFHAWGMSEHHFFSDMAVTPVPECLVSAVAVKTNRIKLRYMSRLISAIHPILIAEQTAATDILSNGRVEVGVARGNTLLQLDAFGVSLDETKERAEEALDLIIRGLSDDTFSHDGKHWGKIPERRLTPKCVQEPHPPFFKIVQSAESARDARRRGLGMITSDMYTGWPALAEYLAAYNDVPESDLAPVVRRPVKSAAAFVGTVRCAKTNDLALEAALGDMTTTARAIINDIYVQLAERSSAGYAHFDHIRELRDKIDDPEYLRNCGPTVLVGDPDHCINQIHRMAELGADEVVLRIDYGTHDEIMSTIEAFGRWVIPHFSNPGSVVRDGSVGVLPGDPRQRPSYTAKAYA
ncbi:LLM class flavin-dependent oxidoreductase [Mycolicibacterium alvei]|uniref:Flavin-dependent oxidoreductase n=1 Tax=Mycolicibacterium alvei TaxID=67081 RepID=A0A6N4UV14_9MYCO|nr:LLM class flavin-dependent oxidoreductase [Mycolicibacterium alvei]MCV7003905.1 LLM class flavin-dependent oxidoreductase [Mycolicibacterium alvei]BBX27663.1 flavin-dependent oxidoreductase [Mycolicibacterium alvei]